MHNDFLYFQPLLIVVNEAMINYLGLNGLIVFLFSIVIMIVIGVGLLEYGGQWKSRGTLRREIRIVEPIVNIAAHVHGHAGRVKGVQIFQPHLVLPVVLEVEALG